MFGGKKFINLKIIIISQYFWPENFRINQLSSELVKKGNQVTVLTGLPNYPEGQIYKSFKENKKDFQFYKGVRVIRVPLIARRKNKIFLLLNYISFTISSCTLGLLKIINEEFDIIFVFQTSPVFIGITSTLISYIKKIPQVLWVLDLWPESLEAVNILNKKWQLKILRILFNFIYAKSSIILCQSKSFIKEINKQNINKRKLLYFPSWSDSEFLVKQKEYAAEIIIKRNFFTIIFAGNIGEAQDFPSIIEAFKIISINKIRNIRLIVIGEGSMKDWLIKEVKLNKLNHIIEIHKKYPLKRMPSFFKHADALLVSLTNKKLFSMTIPGKIQSYLAAGIPIIAMINGEAAEIIKTANAGKVCNAGDYKKLAKNIESLSKESKLKLKRYGLNGKLYTKKMFNKKKLINKLNRLLLSLKRDNHY